MKLMTLEQNLVGWRVLALVPAMGDQPQTNVDGMCTRDTIVEAYKDASNTGRTLHVTAKDGTVWELDHAWVYSVLAPTPPAKPDGERLYDLAKAAATAHLASGLGALQRRQGLTDYGQVRQVLHHYRATELAKMISSRCMIRVRTKHQMVTKLATDMFRFDGDGKVVA